jgi:hypothetical protein
MCFMKARLATLLPFPVRFHSGAAATPAQLFAHASAPPDLWETACAAALVGFAALAAAFMGMLVVCVVSG